MALKAYRIEWNGKPIPRIICGTTLDDWKIVAEFIKLNEEWDAHKEKMDALTNNAYYKKRDKVIAKKFWVDIYYNTAKNKYLTRTSRN